MRADEERKIRPKYRPIIDHDGLPRQGFSTEVVSNSITSIQICRNLCHDFIFSGYDKVGYQWVFCLTSYFLVNTKWFLS